jgi:hypothetical protein
VTLPPELIALRDEAMRTSCQSWAIRKRWKLSAGIDRSGPCPVCGGTDRFSIHTKKNTFLCRHCPEIKGLGVIDLVMTTEKVEFVQACEIITGRKADDPIDPERARRIAADNEREEAKRKVDADRYREDARRAAWAIFCEATNASRDGIGMVADYLALRGIELAALPIDTRALRLWQHVDLPLVESVGGSYQTMHRGPAMIAALRFSDDRSAGAGAYGYFGGVHMTWIDLGQEKGKVVLPPHPDTGKAIPAKKMRGTAKGCAIRLYTPENPRRMVVGEGIETTLTALAHNFEVDTAYWAAGTLGNMSGRAARAGDGSWLYDQPDMADIDCFQPPDWCEELVYLCDSDEAETRTVQAATRGLLRAQSLREGARLDRPQLPMLNCALVEPIGDGKDLNDLVRVVW